VTSSNVYAEINMPKNKSEFVEIIQEIYQN
jgi:hypothetical protein